MKIKELEKYFLNVLNPDRKWLFDERPNGLQIEANEEISKIAFGVTASIALFEKAKEAGADAVLTHHGISFNSLESSIPDPVLEGRLKYLYQNRISLFAYHYLLDHHIELGNNAQILKQIGLEPEAAFALEERGHWGWRAEYKKSQNIDELFEKINELFEKNAHIYQFGKKEIKTVGVCTGNGGSTVYEAYEGKVDLVITGEVSENVQETCRELKLNLIYGGHYITETFGVKALMKKVEKDLDIDVVFVDIPNLT